MNNALPLIAACLMAIVITGTVAAEETSSPPPVTSARPFQKLFRERDPRQLPTIVDTRSAEGVPVCGAVRRADPRQDARIRQRAPKEPAPSTAIIVTPRCQP